MNRIGDNVITALLQLQFAILVAKKSNFSRSIQSMCVVIKAAGDQMFPNTTWIRFSYTKQ